MLISLSHSVVQALHVAQIVLEHHIGTDELRLEDVNHVDIQTSEESVKVRVRVEAKKFEVELCRRHDIDFEYPVKLSEDGNFIRHYFYGGSDGRDLFSMPDGMPLE